MLRTMDEIIRTLPLAEQRDIAKRTKELMAEELTLQELRHARKITQVDPLPEGLGDGGAYEVKINFELSQQSQ